jgi:hypothetical protein
MPREREGGEKGNKVERESPAGDRACGIVCKRSLVFRVKAAIECDIEVRQQARGQKGRQELMSDGKGDDREAKGERDESKIKIERQNIRKMSEYVHNQLNVQRNIWL